MITLGKLIESTSIPASLVRAVVRQAGGWSSFKEMARDVANHGADGGFHGFIYYSDTEPFARRNREAIAEYAEQMASDIGEGGAVELVQGFNCFRNGKPSSAEVGRALYGRAKEEDEHNVLNALAWFALEEVSRAYADMLER